MEERKVKYDLTVVTAELYNSAPERYELRKGTLPDAPLCPYGHHFKWIGFDKMEMKYVRLSKSVFKRLIQKMDKDMVQDHEATFNSQREIE